MNPADRPRALPALSPRSRALALLAGACLWFWLAPDGAAAARGKNSYYFVVSEIKLGPGIPGEIAELVRAELTSAIAEHERLIDALPSEAPDPGTERKAFERYIKRHGIRPFRVNVEVTQYSHAVATNPRGGRYLEVSIALRTFGETIPQRVMAFSGDGSAKIRMDIGKTLRPRDSRVANRDAAQLAIADALALSLERLDKKDKKGRTRGKRGRKK